MHLLEWTNLQRRKSLTFILSLLERERRDHPAANAKQKQSVVLM